MDCWVPYEMNSGSKEGDQAKVDTIGPFAYAFGLIIELAARNRTDINPLTELLAKKGTRLYRGTGATYNELLAYKAKIGKKKYGVPDWAVLTGFISTSMDRAAAESFAWTNPDSGH